MDGNRIYHIAYFGNSPYVAEMLNSIKNIEVKAVFYQPSKILSQDFEALQKKDEEVKCYSVRDKVELKDLAYNYYGTIDFVIMYNFGVIIPQEIIDNIFVFNFHPGDLRVNRGSSPINWAILLGWAKTKMSLYKISAEIDLGDLIAEHDCKIYPCDTPGTLRCRIEGEIPSMMLEILEYLEGRRKSTLINDGVYRKRIVEEDYTINPDTDSDNIINAKIKSQNDYKGAIIWKNGYKYYVKNIDEYNKLLHSMREELGK